MKLRACIGYGAQPCPRGITFNEFGKRRRCPECAYEQRGLNSRRWLAGHTEDAARYQARYKKDSLDRRVLLGRIRHPSEMVWIQMARLEKIFC